MRVYGGRGGVNKAELHLTLKLAALSHTHKRNRMPDEKIYIKTRRILENVVNICIINNLFYPPATPPSNNQNAFFLLPDPQIIHSARGYNRHPRITTAHSAQISTASLGCKVAKLREFVCVRLCEKDAFHTRSATGQPWNILT